MLFMGKSTMSMAMFNSYVKLPKGISWVAKIWHWITRLKCTHLHPTFRRKNDAPRVKRTRLNSKLHGKSKWSRCETSAELCLNHLQNNLKIGYIHNTINYSYSW
jgi:hypothetical protein